MRDQRADVPRTVPELLRLRAGQEPGATAVVVDGQGELTFAEWDRRSGAAARGLRARGVLPGDRVGLRFGGDWIGFCVATCAVHKAGAVAVPVSDRLAPPEAAYMLGHCSAVGVVHGAGAGPAYDAGWAAPVEELERDGGAGGADPPGVRVRAGDLAQILYTSGTTGRPKAVAATHANLTHGCETRPSRRRFRHSRHLLHAFPIGTNAGQMMLVHALDAHPAMLTPARFTPARFARLIESYRPGTVFLVPAMAMELLNAGLQDRHDFSGVLLLGSAAAALPPALAVRLAAAFPNAKIANYYTSTEAAPAQTVMIFDPERPEALGRPAFGAALRVTDERGRPVPPGEPGEIWLRSPAAPRTYYRDGDGGVFADGWVRMGDLGYLDADGYLHLLDRESDVVKSGAYKVSTLAVEAALYEHPGVAEAAVVGVPHPVLGAALAAAVVPRAEGPTPRELRAFLTGRLARHELPERVALVESLPRNQAGKVVKGRVREMFTAAPGRAEGA
ncbi:acyl-CoA synthetase (AMP-forming)/AMP-acid ligase II [Thermocatellispora tengchongensis]|uniref:Acyl-CoA synthetase (AMP-forming)/AMP-acid ligase II n=1 Tax=Thermocatellispora tengchongensis TaxID=1073253 RepID=A0A840P264_9ACTN|nr:class I adenylate-forming enzyme family protein [Thermocatellispora tengchongensis]MBB5132023.1 acyl-CoA synthetase (AMP-forming)/AMP-acid ligase II [Thermocatellispora tengchongensis]